MSPFSHLNFPRRADGIGIGGRESRNVRFQQRSVFGPRRRVLTEILENDDMFAHYRSALSLFRLQLEASLLVRLPKRPSEAARTVPLWNENDDDIATG